MTTDDATMAVLLRHNLDSAYAITRYDQAGFVRAFAGQLGGVPGATQIHNRAKQIFSGVLNVATTFANGRISASLGNIGKIISGGLINTPLPNVPASATLEGLFGSLDYCDCSDCGSILSAAAYLVDLLHYIDQPSPTPGFQNPQTQLFTRRPDLQYLPLTCENTNVALPYIDIVNETLEFFVANSLSLTSYQGHDTGTVVTSAELLASPQYVNDAAYTALQNAFFPAPLPFNRPLELLRLQLQNLGVAVPDAMIAFRADDSITNRKTPTSYGWSDILIEQLGLSRDEYRLFTDSSVQLGDLYGLPNASALRILQTMNLQQFSRLVGVSYVDLIAILQTQFVNPAAALIPKLQALSVSFSTIKNLHDNATQPSLVAQFIASLPPGLDPTQYGGSDGQAVVNWLINPQNYQAIMGLITIANPTGAADDCSGTWLQFRYANPDNQIGLTATDSLKLIRFIRLWIKLAPLLNAPSDSIAITGTDAILTALYPAADLPVQPGNSANDLTNRQLLDTGFAATLLRAGFLFQVMNRLSLSANGSLLQLLACWAPIGTVGPNALYQSMFLTPTLLQQDPGAQTATISTAVNVGDKLTTQINNVSLTHTVASGETPSSIATSIAAAINTDASDTDQVSNTKLNARFLATPLSNQVIIKAGFALSCQVSGGSGGTFTAASSSPLAKTATVGGTPDAGSTLTVTIDTVPITYVVAPNDTLATIATNVAIAINGTTVAHPYSGLPLNTIVAATGAATGIVSINAANPGAPFTLNCAILSANSATYTTDAPVAAGYTASIGGTVQAGDVMTFTINNVPVAYTATATDTSTTALAASLATAINTSVQQDPTTLLPFGSLVHATSNGSVVTVNPIDPATSFTLNIVTTSGAETVAMSGPSAASQTAAIIGSFPAGTILTTTINGLNLFYTVVADDNAASVASKIVQSINTSMTPDLSARTWGGVGASSSTTVHITITAADATTSFTLAVTVSAATYTAGRLSPPFADNGYGVYLTDASQKLFGHEPLLCAAFNLTGDEFAQIATALKFHATTGLTLANVSALFRYGWLAHALSLSVPEFLSLREFSGLDPFAPLDPGATAPAEPPVIRFIRLLQAMNNGNLPAVQALYLIWNQDISGTLAPLQAQITALCFALRADFAAVEAQFVLPDDPDGSVAKGLMALVYGPTVTDFFFGLLNNTFSVAVPFAYASPTLPQPVIDASGAPPLLAYDNTARQLSFSGLLTNTAEQAIAAAAAVATTDKTDNLAAGAVTLTPVSMANIVPGTVLVIDSGAAQETVVVGSATATSFTTTTTQAHNGTATPFAINNDPNLTAQLAALAAASQQAVAPFFATYPELLPLYTAYVASTDPMPTRRETLLANFLPTLKSIRKAEQALAEITASIGCDPSFASALLQNPTVLHADADPTAAAVTDLTAIEAGGLSAQFYLTNNPNAAADQTVDAASPMQYVQTATLSGTPAAGAVLTTTINGTAIAYTASAADTTPAILAGNVAAAINASSASGLPINGLVSAAVISGATIGISGTQALAANSVFSLACSSSVAGVTYTAGNQLPAGHAGGAIAAVWKGFITVPQNGNYNFSVVTDPGATVTLHIAGVSVPMAMASGVWSSQAQVALAAGTLAPIVLTATSIKTTLAFGWQSPPGLGWGVVPSASLYPQNLVTRLGDTYVRFLKATSLASALPLTATDIAWLGTETTRAVNTSCAGTTAAGSAQFTPQSMANIKVGGTLVIDTGSLQETVTVTAVIPTPTPTTFTAVTAHPHNGAATPFPIVSAAAPAIKRGWLNALPGQVGSPIPDLATAAQLTRVLSALLDFAMIKQALSPNDERLLMLLQAPGATLPSGQSALLSLTGWAQVSVNALLTQFFNSLSPAGLADIENFTRVYNAMQIVQACRVAASTLIAAVTNAPTATIVATLQSALRGLYAEADWLTVVRPINDAIRTKQRDALVAHILQAMSSQPNNTPAPASKASAITAPILTADDLYAWFLIDPLTQPVETSRIRLALSSVQLFIERIVRNLEPTVSSADIDATQWDWMKRYRVWQANREVFLWPENWLYPQLRDDQSPMFQQLTSSLLQSDITDDAAANAYLDYLSSLEEVAKLEPCGLYYVPGTADTDEISYVVSRTAGAHRKYYFRQWQGGSWTPWAQVPIDCEDMPLTPIVWNSRLFLFWLKVLKQNPIQANALPAPAEPNASQMSLTNSATTIGDLLSAGPTTSQLATQVTVQAALCWCEYYNGKWQPMKTSDLNRPTTIGSFDPTGDGSFEAYRNQVRIVPATCMGTSFWAVVAAANNQARPILPTLPTDALILAISTPLKLFPENFRGGGSGFLLHNSHSLPIPLEDIIFQTQIISVIGAATIEETANIGAFLDVPAPSRLLEPPYDPYDTESSPYTGGNDSDTLIGYYFQSAEDFVYTTPELSPWILNFNWQPRIIES
jgi:Neuraminidase-like domain